MAELWRWVGTGKGGAAAAGVVFVGLAGGPGSRGAAAADCRGGEAGFNLLILGGPVCQCTQWL